MRIKWFSFVRVTGLLLVLVYHFFRKALPGGFIGVDVFFAFSGFLITALLIDEYHRKQSIDLLGFLKRRFYRIVPPVVIMILVTMPFTLLVRNDFIASIGKQIVAAFGFMTNWYEIFIGSNYENQFTPHLFLHTWSLAVEVHFYIFWGVLIWWLSKRKLSQGNFRGAIFLASTGLFLLGYLTMFVGSFLTDVSFNYFSTFSHSFPFYLGAIYATMSGVTDTTKRFRKNVERWPLQRILLQFIGSFVLLLLLGFILNYEGKLTYLFGFALASLFACLMIYAARALHDKIPDVDEPLVITFFSDISYGIYLFHWPFYIIFSQLMPNWLASLLTFVLSTVFAALSFYVIEPMIAGKEPKMLGTELNIIPYKKWIKGLAGALAVASLLITFMAPKLGEFESGVLVDSLTQADTGMNLTNQRTAGDANAMNNVLIIGDSVALRSQDTFTSKMPNALLDASVSRSFDAAYETFKTNIDSNTLPETVVLAVGVNSPDNYQDDIQQFLDALPDGHRLVLVTPYDSQEDTKMSAVRDYELQLAQDNAYISVADWYQTAQDNPDIWGGTDGVHYSQSTNGADLYVQTIQDAVADAARKPAKGQ
ncbi:acyltransferase [Streptococcus criceti]|uniref:Membrane protein n=1 Tax=Streptococcus criceti HS-6 TaxID=873449 RepID=G5JQC8_STRCG|nr:acyltransferase family protein [Streptococcus criceti]EHI73837.1 putative membrane protein [Streptococcus criceti HS-6]SUN41956.1 acyltransferase [Streptococcus criceti]